MGYLGRRIGLSQGKGDSTPGGADGAVGGGILDLFAQAYFNREGNIYNAPGITPAAGLTATGGVINDYIDGTDIYRAHVFTNSGTFEVTDTGDFGNNIDFLVVGGGGGGSFTPGPGNGGRGGGGAGGLRTNAAPSFPHNLPSSTMAYPGSGTVSYTVTVGAGGLFGQNNNGTDGGNSSIVHPSLNSGTGIVATGGGYGVYAPGGNGGGGGSGGGGAYPGVEGSPGSAPGNIPPTATSYQTAGGANGSPSSVEGGGGGGAGSAGGDGTPGPGLGGNGRAFPEFPATIISPAIPSPQQSAFTNAVGPTGLFGGGGGAGGRQPQKLGGPGGGGSGGYPGPPSGGGTPGVYGTGSGGGGTGQGSAVSGGDGAAGIVVVRYPT